jgi:hypothetical protein
MSENTVTKKVWKSKKQIEQEEKENKEKSILEEEEKKKREIEEKKEQEKKKEEELEEIKKLEEKKKEEWYLDKEEWDFINENLIYDSKNRFVEFTYLTPSKKTKQIMMTDEERLQFQLRKDPVIRISEEAQNEIDERIKEDESKVLTLSQIKIREEELRKKKEKYKEKFEEKKLITIEDMKRDEQELCLEKNIQFNEEEFQEKIKKLTFDELIEVIEREEKLERERIRNERKSQRLSMAVLEEEKEKEKEVSALKDFRRKVTKHGVNIGGMNTLFDLKGMKGREGKKVIKKGPQKKKVSSYCNEREPYFLFGKKNGLFYVKINFNITPQKKVTNLEQKLKEVYFYNILQSKKLIPTNLILIHIQFQVEEI